MKKCKNLLFFIFAICFSSSVFADADLANELEKTRNELAELKKQVAELKSAQSESWQQDAHAEVTRQLVSEIMKDSQTRVDSLDTRLLAGWDPSKKHFIIQSPDSRFLIQIEGQIQVRYVASFRNDSSDDMLSGFQLRRAKLKFGGHVFDPNLGYKLVLANDRDGGETFLEEVYASYKTDWNVSFKVGRFKPRFLREEFTSSSAQLTNERSFINEQYTTGFSEGLEVSYKSEMFLITVMLNDGRENGEFGASTDFNTDDVDLAVTGRIDFKVLGDWKQQKDFTSWSGEELAIFLGAAAHYQMDETGSAGNPHFDFLTWTVDGSVEYKGINAFVAFIGNHEMPSGGTAGPDAETFGLVVQGAYNINDTFEPFVRWERLFTDAASGRSELSGPSDLDIITVGGNWYIRKHNAKITLDVLWALDGVPRAEDGLGLLMDATGEKDQVVTRLQFQLLF